MTHHVMTHRVMIHCVRCKHCSVSKCNRIVMLVCKCEAMRGFYVKCN